MYKFNCRGKGNVVELRTKKFDNPLQIAEIEVFGFFAGIFHKLFSTQNKFLITIFLEFLILGICILITKIKKYSISY